MPLFKFHQVQNNAPSTPVESNSGSADDNTTNSMASTPSSHQSSPGGESCDPGGGPSSSPSSSSRGFRRRLRRSRGVTPRNQEKRPYHSPNHISPPHDKPMTKNDIYFALDCEVSWNDDVSARMIIDSSCVVDEGRIVSLNLFCQSFTKHKDGWHRPRRTRLSRGTRNHLQLGRESNPRHLRESSRRSYRLSYIRFGNRGQGFGK